MPIGVVCACGRKLKAPDAAAGRQARCPECGSNVWVPDPARMPTADMPGCGIAGTGPAEVGPAEIASIEAPPRPSRPGIVYHASPTVQVVAAQPGRGANGLGVASLVFGVLALAICWIPLVGLLSWPFAGFAVLLGVIALIVAAADGRSGYGSAIGGVASGLVAVLLSFVISGVASQALSRSLRDAEEARVAARAKAKARAGAVRPAAIRGDARRSDDAPVSDGR